MKIYRVAGPLMIGLCISYAVHSQSFKGGLHLGMLATQVDGDDRGNYNKPGLFAGAFTSIPLKKDVLDLQLEIDYAQKGSKSKGRISDGTLNKSRLALHQIEVPVLLKWYAVRRHLLTLNGGLSFNLIVDAKVYDLYGDIYPIEASNYDLRFFELGLLLGASYEVAEHLGVGFRFGYSLTPIGPSLYRRIGLRNNFLQFYMGYTF